MIKMGFLEHFQEHNQTLENIFQSIFWNATKYLKIFFFPENIFTWNYFTSEKYFTPKQTRPKRKKQMEMTFVRGDLRVFLEGKLTIYTFKVIRLSIVTLFIWLDLDATCQISRFCLQPSTMTSMLLFSHPWSKPLLPVKFSLFIYGTFSSCLCLQSYVSKS